MARASYAARERTLAAFGRELHVVRQRDEPETPTRPPHDRTAVAIAAELGLQLDPWQARALTHPDHDILLLVSRQGGKGEVATLLALQHALSVPGSTTVVVSRADRQARRLLRRIKRRYRQLDDVPAPITDSAFDFELANGSEVMALPGSEETIRGIEAVDLLIIDEAILVSDDLFTAVYPMLATTNGRCIAMSTARPVVNWFRREWESDSDEWHREQITWEEIPRFTPKFIERTRRRFGEDAFAQEFECAFLAEGAGVFRHVRAAATAEPQTAPIFGHDYVIAVDWGKHVDYTAIAVWDATLTHLVAIDRFTQVDYPQQLGRLQAWCERFKPIALVPERNAMGDPLVDAIARADWAPDVVLPFTTTNASKAVAVDAFALGLETGTIKMIDDAVLIGELQAFAGTTLPSGLRRYAAPEGGHDDCVMAAIIGYHAIAGVEPQDVIVVLDDFVSVSPV